MLDEFQERQRKIRKTPTRERRKKLPSDCDKHENLSVGCQVPSLLPHVGKFDQEADATISTFENGAMLRRLLADIVDSLSISNE